MIRPWIYAARNYAHHRILNVGNLVLSLNHAYLLLSVPNQDFALQLLIIEVKCYVLTVFVSYCPGGNNNILAIYIQ